MNRRNLIAQLGLGITSSAVLTGCQSQTRFTTSETGNIEQPEINWNLPTIWPENTLVYQEILALSDRLAKVTNGKFNLKPSAGASFSVFDDVQNNKVECAHSAGIYHVDKNPALAFSSSLPFGLNTKQQMAWLTAAGGLELTRKAYSDFNIINFPAGSCGNILGGWFKQEVNSLDDLKALNLAFYGLGGEVLKSLGISVDQLSFNELVTGLEQNKVNGAYFLGTDDDFKLGLNNVASYYYYPGWQSPGLTFELMVNKMAFEKLPKNYQEALKTVCLESVANVFSSYENADSQIIKTLASNDSQLKEFTGNVLNPIYDATMAYYNDTANNNSLFKEIYNQWNEFYQTIFAWYRIDELSYGDFVFK